MTNWGVRIEDEHTHNPFWKQGVQRLNNKGRESVLKRWKRWHSHSYNMQMEVAEWRQINYSRSMRIIRERSSRSTEVRHWAKLYNWKDCSRAERLPGGGRKWPPEETFRVQTPHLTNCEWNFCHSLWEWKKWAIREVRPHLNGNGNKEVKCLLFNILNPPVQVSKILAH